ncbi:hypothetical protein HMSSN036_77430 [Paenibacillus macerans]|nr:hypothetical protein HMSSN036_77430 [Paenibacillus macerans]
MKMMKWMMSLALLALVLTACGSGGGQDRAAKGAGNEAGTNGQLRRQRPRKQQRQR